MSAESGPRSSSPPFREMNDPLGEGRFAEVRGFVHDPSRVVKMIKPELWQSETMQHSQKERGFILPETVKDIKHYTEFFDALHKPSNMAGKLIPQTSFVLGHAEDGSPTTFMVQDKIDGVSIDDGGSHLQAHLTHEQKFDLCAIMDGLIDAYIDTYDGERGSTVRFEKNDNFIYGHQAGSQDPYALHYIDVVPLERFSPDRMILELNWSMANFGIDEDAAFSQQFELLQEKIRTIDKLDRGSGQPQVA